MTQNDKELEQLIIKDYQSGLTNVDIQKKYNIGYKKVRRTLERNNIPKHEIKGRPNPKNMRVLTKEEEAKVCAIYRQTGQASDCAKAISSGQDVVRRCLKKYNLYRTASEAIRQSPQNQRKYPVNDNYFSIENSKMAYLMGFIAADGTVRKDTNEIKIGLSSKDIDFLKMIKNELGGRPIKEYTTKDGFDVCSFSCTSKQIKEDLARYNIVPQKTFIFTFPKNLNKKYWIDFIRGYFDGDGSVSTAGTSAIRWQLCSATKDVLETIINFFYEEYNIPMVSIQERKGKNVLYYIQYSSVPTRKIYDILYSDGCLYLPRKKEKFEEIYSLNLKK